MRCSILRVRERPYSRLPLLAIRLQVCSVYVFAALAKLAGGPWRDGYALAWALSDNTFGGTPAGLYLVDNFPGLLAYLGYCIIAFQLSFPFLVFSPWRNDMTRALALASAATMHATFIFCLHIGSFPYISLVALLVLVPDAWLDRALERGRQALACVPNPHGSGWHRTMPLLRAFSAPVAARDDLTPASQPPSGHGSHHPRRIAVTAVGSRTKSGPISAATTLMRQFGVVVCLSLTLLGLATNVDSIGRIKDNPEPSTVRAGFRFMLHDMASVLQVAQAWYLFAPVPTHFRRTYQILAYTADGSVRDPANDLRSPLFRNRADGSGLDFQNRRWRKYLSRADEFTEAEWVGLGQYICRWLHTELALSSGMLHTVEIVTSKQDVDYRAMSTSPTVKRGKVSCNLKRAAT